jgi:hypothetical protein
LLLTVAILVALLVQVNVIPLMVLPLLSFAVAVNCCVVPTAMDGEDGETAIAATVGAFAPEEPQPVDHDSIDRAAKLRTHLGTGQRLFTSFTFLIVRAFDGASYLSSVRRFGSIFRELIPAKLANSYGCPEKSSA